LADNTCITMTTDRMKNNHETEYSVWLSGTLP